MPEWRMLLEMAVYGGILPAVAATALLVAARLTAWPTPAAAARWGEALALGGGLLAGQALLDVAPWRPAASWHWLLYVALAAAVLEAGDAIVVLTTLRRAAATLLVAAAAAGLCVPSLRHLQDHLWLWRGAVAASVVFISWSLSLAARDVSVRWLCAFLTFLLLASAVVIEFAGFGRLSQLAGAAAAAYGGITVALWRAVVPPLPGAPRWAAAVLLAGFLANGYFFGSDVAPASFVVLLAAPVLWALAVLGARRLPAGPWRNLGLAMAAVIPPAAALTLGAQAWFAATEDW